MGFDTAGELKGFTGRDVDPRALECEGRLDTNVRSSEFCFRQFQWTEEAASSITHQWDLVHHELRLPPPFLLLPSPARDPKGVDYGLTAFQATVSDGNIEGEATKRFMTMNKTARASRLFRRRKAVSRGRGLRNRGKLLAGTSDWKK